MLWIFFAAIQIANTRPKKQHRWFPGEIRTCIPFSWDGLVGWGCRIHWLNLCRGVRPPPPNECPKYDIKQSDGEAPALELWGRRSTPSLSLLPRPLLPGLVAPDRVLPMGQILQAIIWFQVTNDNLAQSAGAVEYTDCTSAEG